MVSLIFLGINLLFLSTTFLLIPGKVMIRSPTVSCNFILITIGIPHRSLVFIWTRFQRPFRFPKVDCYTFTIVSFISDTVFIFCDYSIFEFTKEFTQSVFSVESGSYFVSIRRSFSLVPSTYGKFTLILIFFFWIFVACVCCCDGGTLWLLIIHWNILLTMLSWYPFSFNTCIILEFSLFKWSLVVIMEYALLNKEETTLSLEH